MRDAETNLLALTKHIFMYCDSTRLVKEKINK